MRSQNVRLIKKYARALGHGETEQYKATLVKVIKKKWNKTPWNERFKFRKRMKYIIAEHEKQLERDDGRSQRN